MAEASHHRQGLSCRYICGEMIMSIADRYLTHAVENQAPPLQDYNSYLTDIALREAVAREGGGWSEAHLSAFGAVTGGEMVALGYAANENQPKLKPYDDRKSVGSGTSVSVRVDHGGRRNIKKKTIYTTSIQSTL